MTERCVGEAQLPDSSGGVTPATTVNAALAVTARAISRVPSAYGSSSNTPTVARQLGKPFTVERAAPREGQAWAQVQIRDGHAAMAVIAGAGRPLVLIDGGQLFTARTALTALSARNKAVSRPGTGTAALQVTVLYNPELKTSAVMIPGLAGVVLVLIRTMITSLGVVRERQSGTLEQLAVMPVALSGAVLRVPGSTPGEVERALGGLPARVRQAPATLEETFFEITLTAGRAGDAA
jgi:hypothetical protein